MIFDTHAHYEDEAFEEDRWELIKSLPELNVKSFVNVASTWDSLEKTRQIAEACDYAYAAYGIHPDYIKELSDARMEEMKAFCRTEKCLAVGEIGLDYHWIKDNKEDQIYWFKRQLELARELSLPVIIHSRDAAEDTMKIAREVDLGKIGGVVHCYAYSVEQAREYVDMGMYLGIGGVVTFKNAKKLKEVVADIPLSSLVLETDCPYLSPEPNRGRRNFSGHLRYVVRAIADLKGVTAEEVEEVTWANARRMYKIAD